MKITQTNLPGVMIIEPRVFPDGRGFFFESYHRERFSQYGIKDEFVQDNLSYSVKDTLRGLHYQSPHSQAKLVQVLSGEAFDVAVDIRAGSPTLGRWTGIILSSENKKQFYIPKGFAHGFCVLGDTAIFSYKCDDFYTPECEGGILWSDPDLAIDWPVNTPLLSEKDNRYPCLRDIPRERLPVYSSVVIECEG
jgi:dTDP-4-dehydrorhamnose 3,5-epimerase